MIDKLICIYLDFQKVSAEVENIINVSRYGDILFKKQKLKDYHKKLYKQAGIDMLYHVTKLTDIAPIIEELRHNKKTYAIIHHSSFAVTIPDQFVLFIQKIRYLDINLSIWDYDDQKPFVMLNASSSLQILDKISKNPEQAHHLLQTEVEDTEQFKLEKFYKIISTGVDFIEFLHTNFEARYFNQIEKDELFITKRSDNLKKIENEYLFYDFLPDDLKVFFLKPFQLEKHPEWCSYKLEKLNVPDVSIQWIHDSFTEAEFKILLDKLFLFVSKRPKKKVTAQPEEAVNKFYITKVSDRIRELKQMPEYLPIADLIKNSTRFDSIDQLFDLYKTVLQSILKKKNYHPELALSHGDLCASNMLYDKRISLLKLIDPRGADSQDGLFFDSYYDVCKLSHSILGNYDFINNGLFELKYDNNLDIQLVVDSVAHKEALQLHFVKLLERNHFDYELVRVFEASLFISMLPLHIDNPKKVVAFILNAVLILDQLSNQ